MRTEKIWHLSKYAIGYLSDKLPIKQFQLEI
jgi:hypothetical protein